MWKNYISFIIIFNLSVDISISQVDIEWEINFGGSKSEWSHRIITTSKGDVVIAGLSSSSDGDVGEHLGNDDGFVLKIDSNGLILWKQVIGGIFTDRFFDLEEDRDGGYLLFGHSNTVTSQTIRSSDSWLVKLDVNGEIMWEKKFGGLGYDVGYDLELTSDGGYLMTGEIGMSVLNSDVHVIKLDSNYDVVWDKSYGGSKAETSFSLLELSDGSFIIGGRTESVDGDVSAGFGYNSYWLLRLDENGSIIWEKTLQGTTDRLGWDISLADGGSNSFMLAGTNEDEDFLLIKLNYSGDVVWDKSYGGSDYDRIYHINATDDGGYLVGGVTFSKDGDISTNLGENDCWIVKLDSIGTLEWEKTIGGSRYENSTDFALLEDGCFYLSAATNSSDIDVSGNNGEFDIWVVKLRQDNLMCSDTTFQSIEICEGDSIFIGGNQIKSDTLVQLVSGGECDSFVYYSVNYFQPIDEFQSHSICEGSSVSVNGILYEFGGDYMQDIIDVNGCKATLFLEIYANPDCESCGSTIPSSNLKLRVQRISKDAYDVSVLSKGSSLFSDKNIPYNVVEKILSQFSMDYLSEGNLIDVVNYKNVEYNQLNDHPLTAKLHKFLNELRVGNSFTYQ